MFEVLILKRMMDEDGMQRQIVKSAKEHAVDISTIRFAITQAVISLSACEVIGKHKALPRCSQTRRRDA